MLSFIKNKKDKGKNKKPSVQFYVGKACVDPVLDASQQQNDKDHIGMACLRDESVNVPEVN